VVVVRDGHFAYVNPAAAQLLEEPAEALLGRQVWDFLDPASEHVARYRYMARQQGLPTPDRYELTLILRGGTITRRIEIEPRTVSQGESVLVLRDLSPLARDTDLLRALASLAEAVQRAHTLPDIFAVATEGLRDLSINCTVIRLIGDELKVMSAPKDDALAQLALKLTGKPLSTASLPLSRSIYLKQVFAEGRSVFVDDFVQMSFEYLNRRGYDGSISRTLAGRGYNKVLMAPLVVNHRTWGALLLGSDVLSSSDAAALGLFASQVAGATEVAEAIDHLQRTNRQLEAIYAVAEAGSEPDLNRLVGMLLDISAEATHSDTGIVYLAEGADVLVLAGTTGREAPSRKRFTRLKLQESPFTAKAAATGRPVTLAVSELREPIRVQLQEDGLQEIAIFPLLNQGRLTGMLHLSRARPEPYLAEELRAGEQLAGQIAVQVEKARLLQEKQQRVEELALLLDVARVITASLELDSLLNAAAGNLARLIDCDEVFVWLSDPNSGMIFGAATANPIHREHFRQVRLSLQDQTAAARAMLAREPLRIEQALHSPLVNQELLDRYKVHSLLVIPLLLRDEAIGAISMGDTRKPRSWTDAEVERATLVARQVAVAVANARLFDDLKRSYDDLARTQQALVKRERLAALGELAAVVAHEVRNPLGVIFNSVTSLKRLLAERRPDADMLLEMVGEEADRLNRIVGDLLDFARPHEADLRPASLREVAQKAGEAVRPQLGNTVRLRIDIPASLPPVPVDARLLYQALINLLINAVQAMPRGGEVLLFACEAERAGANWIKLEVSDNGPGLSREITERLFEPFFTTKATGTGLGLAVVKRIIEAHKGEVAVTSEEGRGTTFTLWLPR
jgi:signal transduction histidine kinase